MKRELYEHPHAERILARVDEAMGVAMTRTPFDELVMGEPPEPGSDEEEITMTRDELNQRIFAARLNGILAFLRYTWHGAPNLWEAMKRLLAITRKNRPDFIRSMSATDVAWMLGETRAATSAREIRVVEDYLRGWGVLGFQGAGGSKSMEARRKSAASAMGNKSRRRGMRRKKFQRTKDQNEHEPPANQDHEQTSSSDGK